ncbi:MAG: 2-methylcitrate synthase [Gammaproteobacteria bacterium]
MTNGLVGAGLRGQVAGKTALSTVESTKAGTVGLASSGLTYRGYDVQDLADKCEFEEVAFLLLKGHLPTVSELSDYKAELKSLRALPPDVKAVLERIPARSHPMDVLRTGCSFLGNVEPETDFSQQQHVANRMVSVLPGLINYWHHFSRSGSRIEVETEANSVAEQFLWTLHGRKPSTIHTKAMNVSLILYAEHEFNASAFTARVCASTLSDMHSCIVGAIGSLRGPLHGGANEAAMNLIQDMKDPDHAEAVLLDMLARKEKVMGFGHAVYRESDPRNAIIKKWSKLLAQEKGDTRLYDISERCESVMWREKRLFCNADFFHASTYHFMGIPTPLFTPIFVCSRVTGWAGHVMEQRADNRIIRPSAEYVGEALRRVTPIDKR